MKILKETAFFNLYYLILALFIYYPNFVAKRLLDNDYQIVVAPLHGLTTLGQYIDKLKSHIIFDIQPVRDLSIFLALKFGDIFHISNILVYYNFALFITSLFLIKSILKKYDFSVWTVHFIVCFFAIHPVFTQVVPWMSAHKHLLSFNFSLLCIYFFQNSYQSSTRPLVNYIFCCFFYFLAIFSQPIMISLPIWLGLSLFLTEQSHDIYKKIKSLLLVLFIIMLSAVLLNLWYYSGPYIHTAQSYKFIDLGLTERLLSIGRHFIQIIYPFSFARTYYYGSVLNIIGVFLIPIFLMVVNKFLGWKKTILWFSLFIFPIGMMNVKMTNVFVSDSYLLFPCIGILALCILLIEKFLTTVKIPIKHLFFIVFFMSAGLAISSRLEAKLWFQPLGFLQKAYENEKSCVNILNYATYLWRLPEKRELATKTTQELVVRQCQFFTFPSLFIAESKNAIVASVYFTENLTIQAKINILQQSPNPYAKLFLAALYIKNKAENKAIDSLETVLLERSYPFLDTVHDPALDELKKACFKQTSNVCEKFNNYIAKFNSTSNTQERNELEVQEGPSPQHN